MAKKLYRVNYSREIRGHSYVWADEDDSNDTAYDLIYTLTSENAKLVYQDGFHNNVEADLWPEEDPDSIPEYEILNPEDKEA